MPIKSKAQWKYLFINNPEMAKKWQKEYPRDYDNLPDKVEEQEELGLVLSNNTDDLLNDKTLHSYFATPENFDKFYSDVNAFFDNKDNATTINQLKQYLDNLGYGQKTIDFSIDVLSKTAEDKTKEKEAEKDKKEIGDKEDKIDVNEIEEEYRKVFNKNLKEDPTITEEYILNIAEDFRKDYKVPNEKNFWDEIYQIWDEGNSNGTFMPGIPFKKQKQMIYNDIARIIDNYTDLDTTKIRAEGSR